MKTLYLMRHAKALTDAPGLDDFNRPLVEKGIRRTRLIIDFLKERNAKVDMIVCSPAVRTLETAKIMAEGLVLKEESVKTEPSMYSSEMEDLELILSSEIYPVSHLLMIGHNPSITDLVNCFLEIKTDVMPTAGLAALEFDAGTWSDALRKPAKLRFFVYPKMFEKVY